LLFLFVFFSQSAALSVGFWYCVQLLGGFFFILLNLVDMLEGGEIGEDEVSILKGYYLGGFLLFCLFFSRSVVISGVCVVCPIIRWTSFKISVFGNFRLRRFENLDGCKID
jgi:hypothetical protein